jgi:hypothetical protein
MQKKVVETDVQILDEQEPLHIKFNADFYTPKDERSLQANGLVFNNMAKIIEKNVLDWDFTRYKRDESGEVILQNGKPETEVAPITFEFLDSMGSDFIQAIYHAMFEATSPNPKSSES